MRTSVIMAVSAAFLAALAGGTVWWIPRHLPPATATELFDAGISAALAQDRAVRVTSLRYVVSLRIPAVVSEPISGRLEASFDLRDTSKPLAFDFAQPRDHLVKVEAAGRVIEPEWRNGHVIIAPTSLTTGRNSIAFDFVAGDQALNRHDDFLYSLFVPARASLVMPVFDQPNLKARWRLSLNLPNGWVAVANGREAGRVAVGDRVSWLFDDTRPIPPYLFGFAAGVFSVETAERDGRTLRMFHRETDAARLARNRDAIFDLHAKALQWMETYTGIAYPFDKFDFVLLPAFQFGGMEHPGAVFYNANSVLLDATATQTQLLNRANVIAHETAHMWFGDLVTMNWFDDVWMKEVFANFFADKIVDPAFPNVNHPLRFLLQNYPAAYEVDRTSGANPIRQPLDNLSDAGSLYGAIIYQKAPIVMRQLELLVGAEAFRDGLRDYLLAHAFANASWSDLIHEVNRRTSVDLTSWSRAWVDEAGRPTVATDLRIENGRIARLAFRQSDLRHRGVTWTERLRVLIGTGPIVRGFDATLEGPETALPDAVGLPAPDWVLPAGAGLGYGDFQLDEASLAFLSRSAHTLGDPLTRGAAFVTLWEAMLDGRVMPAAMREELLAALPAESDELVRQLLLDETRSVFWRFTLADDRPAVARRLEPVLRAGLDRAPSTREKAAWFVALRSVAITPSTIGWLEAIWRRTEAIPGLTLAEVDESDLAMELAVRGVPDADALLQAQMARITNADRRARFAFILPALSGDPSVRAAFADGLHDRRNRTREAWVLDAVRYLHHPLRARESARLVRPALDLTWTIQRTGDIFFPARWLEATLSGYQSRATAEEVRAFIDALPPDYPPRLRWVLLSAADPLFRAATLLGR